MMIDDPAIRLANLVTERFKDWREFLVLQEDLPPTLLQRLSGQIPVPKTVLFPHPYFWEYIKEFTPNMMIDEVPDSLIFYDPEKKGSASSTQERADLVVKYQLRHGDKVIFERCADGKRRITTINGIPVGERKPDRPFITDNDLKSPRESLGVEQVQFTSTLERRIIFTFGLVALPGKGHRCVFVGPTASGKTWNYRAFTKGVVALTGPKYKRKGKRSFVIILHVGERPEDGSETLDRATSIEHDSENVLFVNISSLNSAASQYYAALTLAEMMRRLTEDGYDVVICMDSFSRVFLAHSWSPEVPKIKEGMIGKGLSTSTLPEVVRFIFAYAGYIPKTGGSATILYTMLSPNENNSEGVPWIEIGKSQATVVFMSGDWDPKPGINLKETKAREQELYLEPSDLVMLDILKRINAKGADKSGTDENIARSMQFREIIDELLDSGSMDSRMQFKVYSKVLLDMARAAAAEEEAASKKQQGDQRQQTRTDKIISSWMLSWVLRSCKDRDYDFEEILHDLTGFTNDADMVEWFFERGINVTPFIQHIAQTRSVTDAKVLTDLFRLDLAATSKKLESNTKNGNFNYQYFVRDMLAERKKAEEAKAKQEEAHEA